MSDDVNGPLLQSFTASDPITTNAPIVHYTLTFSEPVVGLDIDDLRLMTSGGVQGARVVDLAPAPGGNGSQFIVTVDTGGGVGTLALRLDTADIHDTAGNAYGGGTFAPQVTYPTVLPEGEPIDIRLGDLNGDGHLDAVVKNDHPSIPNISSFSIFLGNGDGTFQPQTALATSIFSFSLALGDLNGDGVLDIIGSSNSDQIAFRFGNGDGTFSEEEFKQKVGRGGEGYDTVTTADINGDGKLDVIVGGPGRIKVLLGHGDGGFGQSFETTAGDGHLLRSIVAADVNNDGKLDLVSTNNVNNYVSVLIGDGSGVFSSETLLTAGGGAAHSVAVADFNGDGVLDVVVGNNLSNDTSGGAVAAVVVLLGNGDGTYQPETDLAFGPSGPVTAADVNGDGKADIIATNHFASTVSVFISNGDGTFATPVPYATQISPDGLATGDLNEDGRPDLITTNYGSNSISVFVNQAPVLTGPAYTLDTRPGAVIVGTAHDDTIDATTTVPGQPFPTYEADRISGRGGNDHISGLGGNDILRGGAGNDTLNGNDGNDRLFGDAGADTMSGGEGNDIYYVDNIGDTVIETGAGTDTVVTTIDYVLGASVENLKAGVGSAGLTLTGNNLRNIIVGGDHDDTLIGGGGNDLLEGGGGNDTFVFQHQSDFNGSPDRIKDFASGDRIDLRGLEADSGHAFNFIGTAPFSHHAGEIRTSELNGNTLVSLDQNGDRFADFNIILLGHHDLSAADFLL